MRIRYTVELQHRDLTFLGAFNDSPKMLQRPTGIIVTGRWNQEGVVFWGIIGGAHLYIPVRYLGLHTATRELVTEVGQLLDTLRAKNIPTPGKADWSRNAYLAQLKFDQC
jgi:hypothetical protein